LEVRWDFGSKMLKVFDQMGSDWLRLNFGVIMGFRWVTRQETSDRLNTKNSKTDGRIG